MSATNELEEICQELIAKGENNLAQRVTEVRDSIEKDIARRDEFLSEIVAPDLGTETWKETLADGTEVLIMRGSPNLKEYIEYLHECINDPSEIFRNREQHKGIGNK